MTKIYFLFIATILLGANAMAQTISGVITDENNDPMYGVNVIEKGTTNGTTSDFDGKYSLTLSAEGATVLFKFIGYRDYEIVSTGKSVNHQMMVDEIGLDQVVVSASKRKERLIDAPASVTVLNAEKIENTAAVTAADNMKGVPGVDVMPTGLVSQNVAVRGFNNIFSTAMLTIVDNRIGSVPSLKVNAFQLLPGANEDIEKIEIVRGPGSALYGPNASDGIMHIITKSPMTMDPDHNAETTISMTGGSRSVVAPSFRHSQKVSDKFGFKISGGYMQGHDFEYYDPREPAVGSQIIFGTVRDGGEYEPDLERGTETFNRDFFIQKYNTDARLDFAFNKDNDLTLSGGFANTTNLELTGLGAAQGVGWVYSYGQARYRFKKLFFNYFLNSSNSGDTYLISQVSPGDPQPYPFQTLLDKSLLHGLQIQHSADIKDSWNFIYGADALLTRPRSEGTIYGRYEDNDDINQFGVYGQAEWDATDKLTLLGALRGDYQTPTDEFVLSPRAALVYKPTPRHTTRLTYNRAFSTPSALNIALDLPQTFVPNGIVGRGFGNPTGFGFNRNDAGLPQFRSPDAYTNTGGQWFDVADNSNNHLLFQDVTQSLGAILGESLADNPGLGQSLVEAITVGLVEDANSPVNGVDLVVADFITNEQIDLRDINDLDPVKNTITQTMELGYKGIIKDKLFLSTDLYYTRIDNFVSPLSPASYRVQFDPTQLSGAIAPTIGANLNTVSPTFGITYNELLSGGFSPAINLDSNNDGSVFEELMFLLAGDPNDPTQNGGIYDLSAGTVAPETEEGNPEIASDLLLTYINLGRVDVAGADLGANYIQKVNDSELTVGGMFSFVNKDRIPLQGAAQGFVALNAPKYKTALNVGFSNIAKTGVGVGVNWRWQDAFPANSAIYVGDVAAANLLDLSLSYRPNFSKGTIFTANLYNLTDYEFQRFPGTPAIGFYAMFRLSHTFDYMIGKKKNKDM